MQHTTNSTKETTNLGKKIASSLKGGDIVLLKGNLGAGKTTLVKGIAEYFGIGQDGVVSPTFTLMQEYTINKKQLTINKLIHIDTYRLENEEELIEIGVEDYLGDPETVCIIEWPEKLKKLLKNKKTIEISIEHIDEEKRKISIGK